MIFSASSVVIAWPLTFTLSPSTLTLTFGRPWPASSFCSVSAVAACAEPPPKSFAPASLMKLNRPMGSSDPVS